MDILVVYVVGAILVVAVTAVAPRVGIAAPLLLVALGVAVSLLPAVPAVEIDPEIILAGVLPPLLYATSVAMPAMDFRRDFATIGGLSVVLVVVSALLLGWVFDRLIPGIGYATGVALGAIVSPTDAAATSIVRRLGVSPRLVTVLEGESLLNDASALVMLRSAVAAMAVSVSVLQVAWDFARAVAIAVVIGVVVGRVSLVVRRRVDEARVNTAISLLVPFVAYFPAELLHASGLVAAVAAGMVAGVLGARHLRPRDRLAEATNWRTLEVFLEGAIFFVTGLQLYGVVEDVSRDGRGVGPAVALGGLTIVLVLVIRAGYLAPLLWWLGRKARAESRARDFLAGFQAKLDATDFGVPPGGGTGVAAGPEGTARITGATAGVPGTAAGSDRDAGVGSAPGRGAAFAELRPPQPGPFKRRVKRRAKRRAAELRQDIRRATAAGAGQDERAAVAHRAESLSRRITRQVADIDYLMAEPLGPREGTVLVWAGMRGAVTVAAAQTLPADTPGRSTVVLVAFVVAIGSLLIQGGTLTAVVRRLGVGRPAVVDHGERLRLIGELGQAAAGVVEDPELRRRNGSPYDPQVLDQVRRSVAAQTARIDAEDDPASAHAAAMAEARELRVTIIEAQRAALLDARRLGTYSSTALEDALAILDADQLSAELRQPPH